MFPLLFLKNAKTSEAIFLNASYMADSLVSGYVWDILLILDVIKHNLLGTEPINRQPQEMIWRACKNHYSLG